MRLTGDHVDGESVPDVESLEFLKRRVSSFGDFDRVEVLDCRHDEHRQDMNRK